MGAARAAAPASAPFAVLYPFIYTESGPSHYECCQNIPNAVFHISLPPSDHEQSTYSIYYKRHNVCYKYLVAHGKGSPPAAAQLPPYSGYRRHARGIQQHEYQKSVCGTGCEYSRKRALHGSAPCAEGEAAEHGETGYHRLLGDYACKQRYPIGLNTGAIKLPSRPNMLVSAHCTMSKDRSKL